MSIILTPMSCEVIFKNKKGVLFKYYEKILYIKISIAKYHGCWRTNICIKISKESEKNCYLLAKINKWNIKSTYWKPIWEDPKYKTNCYIKSAVILVQTECKR